MNDEKAFWRSRTVWVNVLAVVGLIVQSMGLVGGSEWVEIEAGALALANVALRLVTRGPVVV